MKKNQNLINSFGPDIWPKVYSGLLLTSLTWATVGSHVRAMKGLNPFLITLSRLVLCEFIVLVVFSWLLLFKKISFKKIIELYELKNTESWILSFVLVAYYFLAIWAFQHISLPIGALLVGAAPFWTLIFRIIAREDLKTAHFFAFGVTMLGLTGITLLKENVPVGGFVTTNLGILLALLSSLCTATSSQLASFFHREKRIYSPLSVTLKVFLLGIPISIVLSPLIYSEWKLIGPLYSSFSFLFITLAIIGTLIPTFLFSSSSKLVKSTVATSFLQLIPVWTLFYSKIFFNEVPTFYQLISMSILFMGLIWTLRLNAR